MEVCLQPKSQLTYAESEPYNCKVQSFPSINLNAKDTRQKIMYAEFIPFYSQFV